MARAKAVLTVHIQSQVAGNIQRQRLMLAQKGENIQNTQWGIKPQIHNTGKKQTLNLIHIYVNCTVRYKVSRGPQPAGGGWLV